MITNLINILNLIPKQNYAAIGLVSLEHLQSSISPNSAVKGPIELLSTSASFPINP